MILLDANYILRYLIRDNEEMYVIAEKTILENPCMVLNEVVAEVVYVLEKVYKVPKDELIDILIAFLSQGNISMNSKKSDVVQALRYYEEKNIDFVDGYLCTLKDEYEVRTFDKKLLKCCQRVN
ncbi:MAG TPA: type II toxin-antitoxin system VapC family toxin [Bacteroidetes bacterium]|nr:type II toxin-antitoxin system VapC family toxin [Bacteroidota bacterium]